MSTGMRTYHALSRCDFASSISPSSRASWQSSTSLKGSRYLSRRIDFSLERRNKIKGRRIASCTLFPFLLIYKLTSLGLPWSTSSLGSAFASTEDTRPWGEWPNKSHLRSWWRSLQKKRCTKKVPLFHSSGKLIKLRSQKFTLVVNKAVNLGFYYEEEFIHQISVVIDEFETTPKVHYFLK